MNTRDDLCRVLSASLGIEREVVQAHARALHEADLSPAKKDGAAKAEPEYAAVLLASLMSGMPPDKAPDAVKLYTGLPLDCANRSVAQGHQVEGARLPDDHPFMDNLRSWGDSFGAFLSVLIAWYSEADEVDFEVINFVVGGGPGTAQAIIYYAALIEGENVVGDVKFSLVPLGGGERPDDAPLARLDWQATVPGTILPVLREFFTGDAGGPREVFMSRANLARLSEEGQA